MRPSTSRNRPPNRWTERRRAALVLDVLRGEASLESAAKANGITVEELTATRDRFLVWAEQQLRASSTDLGETGPRRLEEIKTATAAKADGDGFQVKTVVADETVPAGEYWQEFEVTYEDGTTQVLGDVHHYVPGQPFKREFQTLKAVRAVTFRAPVLW